MATYDAILGMTTGIYGLIGQSDDKTTYETKVMQYRSDLANYEAQKSIYEANRKKVTFCQSDLTLTIEKCENKIKQFAVKKRIEINCDAIASTPTGVTAK